MSGGGQSGQHRKVEQARDIVAQALGDATRGDVPQAAKYVPTTQSPEQPQPKSDAIGVLTVRAAATRLGISTGELGAMVASGKLRPVTAGWTVMVVTSEVERLLLSAE